MEDIPSTSEFGTTETFEIVKKSLSSYSPQKDYYGNVYRQ